VIFVKGGRVSTIRFSHLACKSEVHANLRANPIAHARIVADRHGLTLSEILGLNLT
jgi:hypothetical protein